MLPGQQEGLVGGAWEMQDRELLERLPEAHVEWLPLLRGMVCR